MVEKIKDGELREYREKIFSFLEREYNRKREDFHSIDAKIVQFIVLDSAILALFIAYIQIPTALCSLYLVIYLVALSSLVASLIGFLSLYNFRSLQAVDPAGCKEKYYSGNSGDYLEFLDEVPNGLIKAYQDLHKAIEDKSAWSSSFVLCLMIGIILTIFLKVLSHSLLIYS